MAPSSFLTQRAAAGGRLAWILPVAFALSLLLSGSAIAQYGSPVSVSVTSNGGWVVATGRVNGRLLWQHPLVLVNHQGVSLTQGTVTSFVAVGPRVFQIDNDTGATSELGNRPFTLPPTQSLGGPSNMGESPGLSSSAAPSAPSADSPSVSQLLPPVGNPLINLTPGQRNMLAVSPVLQQRLNFAEQRVQAASALVDWMLRGGVQSPARLAQAEAILGSARDQLLATRQDVFVRLATMTSSSSAAPPTTQQELVDQLERHVVALNVQLNDALTTLNTLKASKARADKIAAAELAVAAIEAQLQAADAELARARGLIAVITIQAPAPVPPPSALPGSAPPPAPRPAPPMFARP